LDELDWDFTTRSNLDDEAYIDPSWSTQISRIRHKLLPLVTIEDSLASELSGGVTVAGGRSGVFVRAGWQSVVTSTRSWPVADMQSGTNSGQGVVANMAARLLVELQYDVAELWQHPAVKSFLRMRRLHLEESAALFAYPLASVGNYSHISPPASWMRSIDLRNPTIYRQQVCLETPVLPPHLISVVDDILHVRLQTLGVREHFFDINYGGTHYTWILYDVGGSVSHWCTSSCPFFVKLGSFLVERSGKPTNPEMTTSRLSYTSSTQRHAWVPYLDDGKYHPIRYHFAKAPLLLASMSSWVRLCKEHEVRGGAYLHTYYVSFQRAFDCLCRDRCLYLFSLCNHFHSSHFCFRSGESVTADASTTLTPYFQ